MNEYLRYLTQQMRYQEYREQAARDRLAWDASAGLPSHDGVIARVMVRLGTQAVAVGHGLQAWGTRLQERPSVARHAH